MLDNMQRIMLSTNDKMNSKEMDTQHIDTMDECDIVASPRKNKTITVPRVQSMQDYILKHHKRLILGEINRQIAGGTLKEITEECGGAVILHDGDHVGTHERCELLHALLIGRAGDELVFRQRGRKRSAAHLLEELRRVAEGLDDTQEVFFVGVIDLALRVGGNG